MPEQSFKERVRLTMINMAKLYKNKYVEYEYLICSEGFVKNHYYIIDAEEDNFQHLTGVSLHSRHTDRDGRRRSAVLGM